MTDNDAASEPLDAPAPPPWLQAWTWIFGDDDTDLAVTSCGDQTTVTPDDDLDADIVVADLQATLAARDAEIAGLRAMVKRPGYDPAKGAVVGQRPRGRPRVVTPDIQALLLRHLRAGQSRMDACRLARISKDSLTNAMRSDPVFKADVQRAEVQAIAGAVRCFTHASKEDWKAAESLLKRRRPGEWAMPAERIVMPDVNSNRAIRDDALAALVTSLVGPVAPGETTHATAPTEGDEDTDDGLSPAQS